MFIQVATQEMYDTVRNRLIAAKIPDNKEVDFLCMGIFYDILKEDVEHLAHFEKHGAPSVNELTLIINYFYNLNPNLRIEDAFTMLQNSYPKDIVTINIRQPFSQSTATVITSNTRPVLIGIDKHNKIFIKEVIYDHDK